MSALVSPVTVWLRAHEDATIRLYLGVTGTVCAAVIDTATGDVVIGTGEIVEAALADAMNRLMVRQHAAEEE